MSLLTWKRVEDNVSQLEILFLLQNVLPACLTFDLFFSTIFIQNTETNQSTRPKVLPIIGDESAGEMTLAIASSSKPNGFSLDGKELRLTSPLDRDHQDISSVIIQVRNHQYFSRQIFVDDPTILFIFFFCPTTGVVYKQS